MLCVSIAYGNGGGLSSYLGGVKASTPAARSLLDPRLRSRRSCPQVGAEEWSFSLTKEYFRKDAFGTFGEGAARGPIKFRDQKPLKTPRFACPGSAYVYLRQSTTGQVEHNRESTQRQYALVSKAATPRWAGRRSRLLSSTKTSECLDQESSNVTASR